MRRRTRISAGLARLGAGQSATFGFQGTGNGSGAAVTCTAS